MTKEVLLAMTALEIKETFGFIEPDELDVLNGFFELYPHLTRSKWTKEDIIYYALEGLKKSETDTREAWLALVERVPRLGDQPISLFHLLT